MRFFASRQGNFFREIRQPPLDVVGFLAEEGENPPCPFAISRAIRNVLVTGPTGSATRPPLSYAAINRDQATKTKSSPSKNPSTIRFVESLKSRQRKKGLTFARGLRSILRPRSRLRIMVGEIRGPGKRAIAIQSALTGHLFYHRSCPKTLLDVIGPLHPIWRCW